MAQTSENAAKPQRTDVETRDLGSVKARINFSYFSGSEYNKLGTSNGSDGHTLLPNSQIGVTSSEGSNKISLSGAIPQIITAGAVNLQVNINTSWLTLTSTAKITAHESQHINILGGYIKQVEGIMGRVNAFNSTVSSGPSGAAQSQSFRREIFGRLTTSRSEYLEKQRNLEQNIMFIIPRTE